MLPCAVFKIGSTVKNRDDLHSLILEKSKRMIEENKEEQKPLAIILFVEEPDVENIRLMIMDVSSLFSSKEGKETAAMLIRDVCEKTDAHMMALVSEAHMLCAKKNENFDEAVEKIEDGTPVSEMEGSKEILMVRIEDLTKSSVYMYEIKTVGQQRTVNEKPEVIEGTEEQGILTNFMKKRSCH
jgi:hypothetical protein